MRLWSLHPKYLDARGLVAAWREGLLAKRVLHGKTKGYRSHPQLDRFKSCGSPKPAIGAYLRCLYAESLVRGYRFDASKIGKISGNARIPVTLGQVCYEWKWLSSKLKTRDARRLKLNGTPKRIETHPLFRIVPGKRESWEKIRGKRKEKV